MIPPETISQVRERTDMVAIVQEAVPSLKRRGRSWSGLCPFHKEKSPSFHVNPERGFFKCFGCGEGGDVITFVMREYGYTFAEAVRMLAERLGIEIQEERRERTDVDRAKQQKDDVYAANAMAATWFEEQLRKHPLRHIALEELARRGIVPGASKVVDDALQQFRIGYAPDGWDGLATFFRQQGVSPVVGELAGLIGQRSSGSGHYDRFRHRLMFSVLDIQGRVVAFSGRALPDPPGAPPRAPDQRVAKYINSTETPVYKKGNVLFGLFQARHAIREQQVAVIVEGNFDVFSLHARGFTNVVAPLGTAFTPEQATLLKRYAPTVVLLFDGDAAGRAAVKKSRGACMEAKLVAKVAALPDGVDPDDFARTRGVEPLVELVDAAKGLLEFLIDAELDASFVAADAREKLARVDAVADLIASEPDPLVRMMAKGYADMVAGRLDIHGDAFRALEQKIKAAARKSVIAAPSGVRSNDVSNGANSRSAEKGPGSSHAGGAQAASRAPKTPGSVERRAIVGALLEYPSLLDDPDAEAACALLEGPAALTVASLRRCWATSVPSEWAETGEIRAGQGEKRLDTAAFLAQIPLAIQAFASQRLAAPEHETESKAKETLLANAEKLKGLLLTVERLAIERELRTSKDGADDFERLRQVDDLERQRRGAAARGAQRGNANAERVAASAASGTRTGATPDEERQATQQARDRDEREERADREARWSESEEDRWPGPDERGEWPEGEPGWSGERGERNESQG